MNNKENQKFIKKKIIEALKIDAKVDWSYEDPNKEFKEEKAWYEFMYITSYRCRMTFLFFLVLAFINELTFNVCNVLTLTLRPQ